MAVAVRPFCMSPDGKQVHAYEISTDNGESIEVLDFGATLRSIHVYDGNGKLGDVCLGFASTDDYASSHGGSMGGSIGRIGNRIAGASFELNGKHYTLYPNEKGNNLHSGPYGYHLRMWQAAYRPEGNEVTFLLFSPDNDQGYPGNTFVAVTYSLIRDRGCAVLGIQYHAASDADTIINMTNHSYFNLAGCGDVKNHMLTIDANSITATNDALIPTGGYQSVAEAGLDFTKPRRVGEVIDAMDSFPVVKNANGIDANFVVNSPAGSMRKIAELSCGETRRVMSVYSDQPGVQCYSGQGLQATGKYGDSYCPYSGICLETQHYPDSIHHPEFPSVVLKAGDIYSTRTEYHFSIR